MVITWLGFCSFSSWHILKVNHLKVHFNVYELVGNEFHFRRLNGIAGASTRRRVTLEKQGPTVVHQKAGPLQTIFELPADEVNIFYGFLLLLFRFHNTCFWKF